MPGSSRDIFAHPFLDHGFRPFFLLGALYSVITLLIWGSFFSGYSTPPSFMVDPVSWHAHEMIFGFTMAIVAGFLLTAVANWTGVKPVRQIHLLGLCALWIAGRIVMNFDLSFPQIAVIFIEGTFLLTLAISLSVPLLKSWNKRNFVFLILLSILLACDMTFLTTQNRTSLYVAVMIIVTMISLIGGRVIPAFTVVALHGRGEKAKQTPQEILDAMAILSLAMIILMLMFIGQEGVILATTAFLSAIIHALRMRHYHTHRILRDPMIGILHVGYGWIIVGLFMLGVSALNFLPFSISLHAFTAGAIGSMTLGMMCRVALAHTGRKLNTSKLTISSFILLQCAALMRVLGLVIAPDNIVELLISSATFWAISFALYILTYAPILWKPNPDSSNV